MEPRGRASNSLRSIPLSGLKRPNTSTPHLACCTSQRDSKTVHVSSHAGRVSNHKQSTRVVRISSLGRESVPHSPAGSHRRPLSSAHTWQQKPSLKRMVCRRRRAPTTRMRGEVCSPNDSEDEHRGWVSSTAVGHQQVHAIGCQCM